MQTALQQNPNGEVFNYPVFKCEIDQPVFQRMGDDGWETTVITARTFINGNEVYKTEALDKWVPISPSFVPYTKPSTK